MEYFPILEKSSAIWEPIKPAPITLTFVTFSTSIIDNLYKLFPALVYLTALVTSTAERLP